MTATEAKAKFLGLLDDVAAGETVEITKHGRIVARLVQAADFTSLKGSLRGSAVTTDPDDDLLTTGVEWNLG